MSIGVSKDDQWRAVCEGHMRAHWREKLRERAASIGKMAGMSQVDIEEDLLPHLVDVAMEAGGALPIKPPGVYLGQVPGRGGQPADVWAYTDQAGGQAAVARAVVELWQVRPECLPGRQIG